MRLISAILLLTLTFCSFGQNEGGNADLIEKIKTKKPKSEIERLLVGHWEFVEKQTPKGEKVDTIFHNVPNGGIGIEKVKRPDYMVHDDMTYSNQHGIDNDTTDGTWIYKVPDKEVVLTFHEPVLPVDDSMPEEYIKSLIEQGLIRPIEYSFFEIHKIDDNELWIIEHLPHSEHELKYNLLYYKKK